jgi:acetate kinase
MPQGPDRPVLVVNAGSTGVKLALVDAAERGTPLGDLAGAPDGVGAVGHRVVHGGDRFRAPLRLGGASLGALEEIGELAPLHNVPAVEAARRAMALLPGVPHVAVFDTAFHAGLPEEAATYALPRRWREDWGIRRVGFHGLSVAWSAERAAALLRRDPADLRLVVCHLGGGCSATAVLGGRSVDTTMGFSPQEGLVMATRCGSVDPAIAFHLIGRHGMEPRAVEDALTRGSGLLGLAGSADMREVERAAAKGDPDAARALAVHDHRLAAAVAGMVPALGGLDALVFTGGVGEGSARTRAEAGRRLAPLGVGIPADGGTGEGDREITAPGARVRTLVVHAREDVIIARAVREELA